MASFEREPAALLRLDRLERFLQVATELRDGERTQPGSVPGLPASGVA